MKFTCACGELVLDITDSLSYKAHWIADQSLPNMLDDIDALLNDCDGTPQRIEAVSMQVRSLLVKCSRPAYQCNACGRVHIDRVNNTLQSFHPEVPSAARGVFAP